MPNLTFRERLIAGLLALGYKRDLTDRSHYEAFTRPGLDDKLFVGTNGALRKGHCASKSWSIGDATRQTPVYSQILAKGTPVEPNFD